MRCQGFWYGIALTATVIGCTAIAGLDGDYEEVSAPSGSVGIGGAGVATCGEDADCPSGDTACQTRACDQGRCVFQATVPGTRVSSGELGDCKAVACDGLGNESIVDDDDDLPDDGLTCTVDTCNQGTPVHGPAQAGKPCTEGGGVVCDGVGQCVACLEDAQCGGGLVCQQHVCVAPTCIDGSRNGNESDVDCGGSCAPCGPGMQCGTNADCAGALCVGVPSTCAATCSDGVTNQDETDVDCGGVCGATCPVGQQCNASGDCATSYCSSGTCQSACGDGQKDLGETDVDCAGRGPD